MTNSVSVNWNKVRHLVRARFPLLLVGAIVLVLSGYNNDFPEGLHIDEIKKVSFVQTGKQDFHHPVLLLQSTRLAIELVELFVLVETRQTILEIGRWVTAMFAVLAWWFSFLLFRKILSKWEALLVATIAACTPIIAIHAHYMKEDIFLLAGLYATMWALANALDHDRRRDWLIFAIALGLCLSSHYKALVLGPVLLLMPWFKWRSDVSRLVYWKLLKWGALSLLVFVAVNYPLLLDIHNFIKGFGHESTAAIKGHFLTMYGWLYGYTFYLQKSIVPGISLLLTIPALAGLVLYAGKLGSRQFWLHNTLFSMIVIFYLAVEISPKKPHPDFMRYIMPVIPAMILFAYLGVKKLAQMAGAGKKLAIGVMLALSVYPIYDTIMLIHYLPRDTRLELEEQIAEHGSPDDYYGGAYTKIPLHDTWRLAEKEVDSLRKKGKRFLVVSSFSYGRYLKGMNLSGQHDYVYKYGEIYQRWFEKYPYTEIEPAYKSFAFSNPTIRILDIREKKDGK